MRLPCVRVSVRPSIYPGFLIIIWKSNHSIDFKFGVGICWMSVQNWFSFGQCWPSSGKKITENGPKCLFSTIIWKSIHTIQFKLGVYTYWVSVQKWFAFWPCWPNFGPLVATSWLKMVVSHHYLKKHSRKPIQTCSVHLLGDCSELVCFLVTLAKFWPSSGHKMKLVVCDHYLKKY